MENVCYTAQYKVAKRLDFLLDICIEKNREKNLVVWPRLYKNNFHIFPIKASQNGSKIFKGNIDFLGLISKERSSRLSICCSTWITSRESFTYIATPPQCTLRSFRNIV